MRLIDEEEEEEEEEGGRGAEVEKKTRRVPGHTVMCQREEEGEATGGSDQGDCTVRSATKRTCSEGRARALQLRCPSISSSRKAASSTVSASIQTASSRRSPRGRP
jgi:hypothetical protein